jgi:hypothetical protein
VAGREQVNPSMDAAIVRRSGAKFRLPVEGSFAAELLQ